MQHNEYVFVHYSFWQFCLSNNYALRLFAVLSVAKILTVSNDNANIHNNSLCFPHAAVKVMLHGTIRNHDC